MQYFANRGMTESFGIKGRRGHTRKSEIEIEMNRRERRGGENDGVRSEQVDIIVSSWTIFSDGREIKKMYIFPFHTTQR